MVRGEQERDEFGDQLHRQAEGRADLPCGPLRRLPNSLDAISSLPGIQFTYMFRERVTEVAMYLMDGDENDRIYERLRANRSVVEAAFGGPLEWLPREKRQMRRIRLVITTGGYLHRGRWQVIQQDMLEAMARLYSTLGPYLTIPTKAPQPTADPIELALRIASLQARSAIPRPPGQAVPEKVIEQRQKYARDPQVIVWMLQQTQGLCELCGQEAPFVRADGKPYLEVHHVFGLAEGGSDTVENAAALCPNCHRRLHHATDADHQRERLYAQVERLVPPDSNSSQ